MAAKPTKVRWSVFALISTTSWLLYLHRYVFAAIKPKIAEEYDLGTDVLGRMDVVFAASYMGFQFPLGVLADTVGVHLVLSSLILIGSLGLAMHAFPWIWAVWFARAALGFGQSAVFATINRTTRTWFPLEVRTTVQGWAGVFFGRLGGACAGLIFSTFLIGMLLLDWRTAVYVFAAVGVLHAAVFALVFRNTPRQHPWANDEEASLIEGEDAGQLDSAAQRRLGAREMFARMSPRSIVNLLCLNVQSCLSTLADNIYSNWIPLFLVAVHGLEYKKMGYYWLLPLLGGALGGAFGGYLNDFCIRRTGNRRWSRTGVALCGKGMASLLIFVALIFFYDRPYGFCITLFFVKFFGDWSLSTGWGTISDIGGRTTASVFAFNNSVAGIAAIGASELYGQVVGHYEQVDVRFAWQVVFAIVGVTYALCALSWLFVNCTIPLFRADEETELS